MKAITFLFLLSTSVFLKGQNFGLEWGFNIGGEEPDFTPQVILSENNQLIVCGNLRDTVDFDPSPNQTQLYADAYWGDTYLAKYTNQGSLVWVKQISGTEWEQVTKLDVDGNGDINVWGMFVDTLDCDPSSNSYLLIASQGVTTPDKFIAKYDSLGNLISAKQIADTDSVTPMIIKSDSKGNTYELGSFSGTVDIDPSDSTFYLTAQNARDYYILKKDANEHLTWAISYDGGAYLRSLNWDSEESIYITGGFADTADFDPGPNIFNLVSAGGIDAFILKLDSAGLFKWVVNIAGSHYNESIYEIDFIDNNSFVTSGMFYGATSFHGVDTSITLNPYGIYKTGYIASLNVEGDLLWVNQVGQDSIVGVNAPIVISNHEIMVSGSFNGIIDFDHGNGTHNVSSNGYFDGYYLCLSENGNFKWVNTLGTNRTRVGGVIKGQNDKLYIYGNFDQSMDVDPSTNVYTLTSNGWSDFFLIKLKLMGIRIDENLENEIIVYPNPAAKEIKVDYKESISFVLYSLNGAIITESRSMILNPTISFEQAPNGVYILHLFDRNKHLIGVKKIVIAN